MGPKQVANQTPSPPPPVKSEMEEGANYRPFLRGLAWTAAGRWPAQVITWGSTLIIVRLLSPADFGIVGMATVYLGLITLLSEFGVGDAVVYLRDLTRDQIAQVNTVSVILGIAAFAISCAMAPALAWFFRTPDLVWVVVAMGVGFVISAFQVVPGGLLQKEKSFKVLSFIDVCRVVTRSLSTLLFAFFGFRYWSLVIGGLLGGIVSVLLTLRWRRESFARPKLRSIRRALEFSRDIIITRLSWYAYSNADFVVAGRVLGQVPLGAYSVARNLSSAPIEKITDLMNRVTPAFFSEIQNDPAMLRKYLRNLTEGISVITFPAMLGLALVSKEIVPLVLGAKWLPAVVPLELLALYGLMRSITIELGQSLLAIDVRWWSRYMPLFAVVFPTAFFIGSHWGTAGIAAGWVCLYPLMYIPIYRHVFRLIEMKPREYFRALWPALSSCLAMTVVVIMVRLALPAQLEDWLHLGAEVLAGAACYTFALRMLHRDRYNALLRTLRSVAR